MLTDKGFQRPTFDELLAGRIDRAKHLFGDDVDTTERSALGKFIRLGVYDLAQAYETLEATYYARFPNSASGQSLDRLMPFACTRRDPAVAAVHRVELAGTAGYAVPVGFLVASAGGQTFHTMAEAVLGADGTARSWWSATGRARRGTWRTSAGLSTPTPTCRRSGTWGWRRPARRSRATMTPG